MPLSCGDMDTARWFMVCVCAIVGFLIVWWDDHRKERDKK